MTVIRTPDGLSALLEYAFGSINGDSAFSPESEVQVGSGAFEGGEFATLTYRRNLAADDVLIEVQVSEDLVTWVDGETVFVQAAPNGDGTELMTFRTESSLATIPAQYIRVKVTLKE